MKHKESHDILAKLIIIGDSGVGKTNLILNFVGEQFKESYVATIGVDFKAKTITIDNKKVKLQIWDTAGQQRFRTITQTYYKGASGIILAYSVIDRQSFQNMQSWMLQITEKAPPGIPKLILANKKDLIENRTVSEREGQQMFQRLGVTHSRLMFAEVSAKTGEGVEDAFRMICKEVKSDFEQSNVIKPVIRIAKTVTDEEKQTSKCKC